MTLFERTKDFSNKRGYSLQTTAEKAGLSKNAIYNWKTKQPSPVSVKAVADVLGVSADYLLGNTKEPGYHPFNDNEEMNPKVKVAARNMNKLDDADLDMINDMVNRFLQNQKSNK